MAIAIQRPEPTLRFKLQRRCPKCGAKGASVEHQDGWRDERVSIAEVLKRQCQRCGYRWDEKPLDAATA